MSVGNDNEIKSRAILDTSTCISLTRPIDMQYTHNDHCMDNLRVVVFIRSP